MHFSNNRGFTLIELSIVLVIIGLLVGGILTGRDLISAAELRSVISQVDKFTSAVNTFRLKYNCLPGDCLDYTSFGLATRANTVGQGDGNGLIESSASGDACLCGETLLFWNDLSVAQLVAGSFLGTDGQIASNSCNTGITSVPMNNILPPTKISGTSIHVYSANSYNYFDLLRTPTSVGTRGQLIGSGSFSISPIQAFQVDSKSDDGLPASGTVTSVASSLCSPPPVAGAATNPSVTQSCANSNVTPNTYNMNPSTGGNTPLCDLQIRAGF